MEKVRGEKMQMREKVGKSRITVFFRCFVAPEGRKVGSLKPRVSTISSRLIFFLHRKTRKVCGFSSWTTCCGIHQRPSNYIAMENGPLIVDYGDFNYEKQCFPWLRSITKGFLSCVKIHPQSWQWQLWQGSRAITQLLPSYYGHRRSPKVLDLGEQHLWQKARQTLMMKGCRWD